jgi:sugar lactone lactonase YvrE
MQSAGRRRTQECKTEECIRVYMRRRLAVLIFFSVLAQLSHAQTNPLSQIATETTINGPSALALDRKGHLYVIEMEAGRVLGIDLGSDTISVVAGNRETSECAREDGIPASRACLQYPESLAVDLSDNLFIGELAGYVRKIDLGTGLITTVAGDGKNGNLADGESALSAHLGDVTGITFDSRDNLFITDTYHERILKLEAETGRVIRFAGNGNRGFSGDGRPALLASFQFGSALCANHEDDLLIADFENCRIRKIDHATTVVTTVALSGSAAECATHNIRPGPFPSDPVVDSAGNIYFIEGAMDVVRRIDARSHQLTTVAGTGVRSFAGDGGPAAKALLANPSGLAIDSAGNLFIAEFENNRIRRVDASTGIITTIAGNGKPGHHPTVD